ncbi:MAG: hypothetical protein DRQ54_05410 [Gammaproteobacteria bacterium]|nr:MAG: hypothetical protein DRQ54_05410 [Gammaproteobacteria bacterium]RLA14769.1 MAG: hypothetical protein DRQ52_03405 [Gammaproteobacteria bacterium]
MTFHPPERPVRLELVVVDERVRQTFELMFAKMGKGHGIIVNATVSEASIIDIDSQEGVARWKAIIARAPQRPLILISLREWGQEEAPESGVTFLQKPIKVSHLLAVLANIRRKLDEATAFAPQPSGPFTVPATSAESSIDFDSGIPVPELVVTENIHSLEKTEILAAPVMNLAPKNQAQTRQVTAQPPNSLTNSGTGIPVPETAAPENNLTLEKTEILSAPVINPVLNNQAQTDRVTTHPVDQVRGTLLPNETEQGSRAAIDKKITVDFSDLIGNRTDVDISDDAAVKALQMDTRGYFLDIVKAACNHNQKAPVRIQLSGADMVIDPENNRVTCRGSNDLRSKCMEPIAADKVSITPLDSQQLRDVTASYKQLRSEQIHSLLWRLALWTYRGRLPQGTRARERAYLAHWPNLTRLAEIPDAMRIASLWSTSPIPISHVAEALKIPQRHVFAFYGAAHAIGLAGPAMREADKLIEPALVIEHQHRSMLSSMATRLRGLVGS